MGVYDDVVVVHAAGWHYDCEVDEESSVRRQAGDVGGMRHERNSSGEGRRSNGHRTAGQQRTAATRLIYKISYDNLTIISKL